MKVITIILGVLLAVGGFYCVITPGTTFLSMWLVVGLLLLLSGISIIANYAMMRKTGLASGWDLVAGIITIVLGLIVLISPTFQILTDAMLVYIFAAWLVISGIYQIVNSVKSKKAGARGCGS